MAFKSVSFLIAATFVHTALAAQAFRKGARSDVLPDESFVAPQDKYQAGLRLPEQSAAQAAVPASAPSKEDQEDASNVSYSAEEVQAASEIKEEDADNFAEPDLDAITAEDFEGERGAQGLISSSVQEEVTTTLKNVSPVVDLEAGYVGEQRQAMYRGPVELIVDVVLLPILTETVGLAATMHFISQTCIIAGLFIIGAAIVYFVHRTRQQPVRGVGSILCSLSCFCCGGPVACFYPIDEKSTTKYYSLKSGTPAEGGEWTVDSDDDDEDEAQKSTSKTLQPPEQEKV
mmetsp:Transcript_20339/g.36333  ORF Transcript_20339/g.36333 Transcript_20339/m.36333 type:complete len:288 (-) Transcript_20339:35-898(-)